MTLLNNQFGFQWGPVRVTRLFSMVRKDREHWAVSVNDLDIYVSKTGRSVRVFRDGKELK